MTCSNFYIKELHVLIFCRPHYQMTSVGRISKPPAKFQMLDVKSLLKNAKKKPKLCSTSTKIPPDDAHDNDTAESKRLKY